MKKFFVELLAVIALVIAVTVCGFLVLLSPGKTYKQ